jgi:hypothetical protein
MRSTKGGPEGGILDAELIDECTTLFPSPVGLIRGCKRGVKELGARFERFDVPGRRR